MSFSASGTITFAINGERVDLNAADVDPTQSLNEFIRETRGLKGTKLVCGEGGCGACAIVTAKIGSDGKPVYGSMNSCLQPVVALDGYAITTVEGLGSSKEPGPVQERIAAFNGTQCGMCTSGFVCTISATYAKNPNAKMEEVEKDLDGNLCRCTGYRPILDAARHMASDSDIEDVVCGRKDFQAAPTEQPKVPEFLSQWDKPSETFVAVSDKRVYVRAASVDDAVKHLAVAGTHGRVVAGNTSHGIYQHADRAAAQAAAAKGEESKQEILIDVSQIGALRNISVDDQTLSIGGACTLRELIETLESNAAKSTTFAALAKHVRKIANVHVRAVGTVAGNLSLARARGFWSDLATLCLAADVQMEWIGAGDKRCTQSIAEFLAAGPEMPKDQLIASLQFPVRKADDRRVFASYRAALRKTQCHAYINAAFEITLSKDGESIESARVAYGAVGEHDKPGKTALRAEKVEEALAGAKLGDDAGLKKALKILRETVKPELGENEPKSELSYRRRLVASFLFKFVTAIAKAKASARVRSAGEERERVKVSRGTPSFEADKEDNPVHLPSPKTEAILQSTGEAQYTDDIPVRQGTVHAALVLSTIANGSIEKVDTSKAEKTTGFLGFFDASHVQNGNDCNPLGIMPRRVFAEGKVQHYGQQIGIVVADTQANARHAASLVKVDYKEETPCISVRDAIKRIGAGEEQWGTPVTNGHQRGDAAAVLTAAKPAAEKAEDADHWKVSGELDLGTQAHFYLEPQSVYAFEDEDGVVQIHTGSQWPVGLQGMIAKALSRPMNRVRCVMRRAGGGFGGRLTHHIQHAVAAAIATTQLHKPVKLILDRRTDLLTAGGREETHLSYDVAFDRKTGKIKALTMDAKKNAGYTVELAFWANGVMCSGLSETYDLGQFDIKCGLVLTNTPARSATRGPGDVESSFVIESIMEHIADVTGLTGQQVRDNNLVRSCGDAEKDKENEAFTCPDGKPLVNYVMPEIWDELKKQEKFDEREKEIVKFNADNRFKKRGIALTPVRYMVGAWPRTAQVNVYGDGSITLNHGGAEIGQGLNTKAIQAVAFALGKVFEGRDNAPDLVPRVRVTDNDSLQLPNQGFTGGSTGSEGVVKAAMNACEQIVPQLKSVLEDLIKEAGEDKEKLAAVTWEAVCTKASTPFPFQPQNLSAVGHWSNADPMLFYQIYGGAVSEVELDVLTGEVQVLASALRCDTGRSLNPAIDIGQAEGAFMMGLGYMFSEQTCFDEKTGEPREIGTWSYKPPLAAQTPERFDVALHRNHAFKEGIMSSKASGEPPLVLSVSAAMAARAAVVAARKDAGLNDHITLPLPYSPPTLAMACAGDDEDAADAQLTIA